MRQSQLFTKTRKDAPKDEVSTSARLLIRAGFVSKEMAGVYSMLPLALRVLEKIKAIIRVEIQAIGGQEVSMTALQDPAIWKASDRWDDAKVDNWFKTKLKNEAELGLGVTHEEPLARIMSEFVSSYRDLPKYVFQIQTKFRNELRTKSGILRGREFLMKDLYSFTTTSQQLDEYYERVAEAYRNIFMAIGLGDMTFRTYASGGMFSKFSDEFQTVCDSGEDIIYLSREKQIAVNKEILDDEVLADLKLKQDELEEVKAIEVGNIFKLGTKYSEAIGLMFTDEAGKNHPVVMGSYGIGVTRLLGTVAEVFADENGLVWPKAVAPFDVHLIELNPKHDATISAEVTELTEALEKHGAEVLHDDRDLTPGQKFADSDLIGIPTRIVVSEKTIKAGKFEVKDRRSGEVSHNATPEIMHPFSKGFSTL